MRDKGLNMNLVAVEGGNKTQREICEKVVHYMIGKLMPRMRTLDIEVQPSKIGIHISTKFSFIEIMYEMITVKIGMKKQANEINLSLFDIIF